MTGLAVAAILTTIGAGLFAVGMVETAHGHFFLPLVLFPLGLIPIAIFVIAPNKRAVRVMLDRNSELLQDVTQLLDATFTLQD
jgi:hypothetical protein